MLATLFPCELSLANVVLCSLPGSDLDHKGRAWHKGTLIVGLGWEMPFSELENPQQGAQLVED
jgi:hypothetical protein